MAVRTSIRVALIGNPNSGKSSLFNQLTGLYQKVLNDNRGVTNHWADAAEWVGCDWIPEMVQSGLRYFAWVLPHNFESRVSTELTIYYIKEPVIATFDSLEDARCWLKTIPAAT